MNRSVRWTSNKPKGKDKKKIRFSDETGGYVQEQRSGNPHGPVFKVPDDENLIAFLGNQHWNRFGAAHSYKGERKVCYLKEPGSKRSYTEMKLDTERNETGTKRQEYSKYLYNQKSDPKPQHTLNKEEAKKLLEALVFSGTCKSEEWKWEVGMKCSPGAGAGSYLNRTTCDAWWIDEIYPTFAPPTIVGKAGHLYLDLWRIKSGYVVQYTKDEGSYNFSSIGSDKGSYKNLNEWFVKAAYPNFFKSRGSTSSTNIRVCWALHHDYSRKSSDGDGVEDPSSSSSSSSSSSFPSLDFSVVMAYRRCRIDLAHLRFSSHVMFSPTVPVADSLLTIPCACPSLRLEDEGLRASSSGPLLLRFSSHADVLFSPIVKYSGNCGLTTNN